MLRELQYIQLSGKYLFHMPFSYYGPCTSGQPWRYLLLTCSYR